MEKVHKPPLSGKKRKHKTSTSEVAEKSIKLSPEVPKPEKQKKISNKTSELKSMKEPIMKTTSEGIKMKKKSGKLTKSPKKSTKSNIIVSDTKNDKLDESIDNEGGDEDKVSKKAKKKGRKTLEKKVSLDAATPLYSNEEIEKKYPVLYNKELITQFQRVQITNNQKGRIRQAVKLSLHGAPPSMYPDLVHSKLQAILKGSEDLTPSELRRVRILYNMLKTAIKSPQDLVTTEVPKKKEKSEKTDKTDKSQKVKGPKRYVVFLGNLPLDIDREKIMNHFVELNESIKDIRIPKPAEGKKSAIAYVELMNEPSFELALSKHHSMLGSKRINVLYTAQKNGKISKSKAKGKSAKLTALQKSGKLVGSIPMNKKRSHRRAIAKKAKAAENKDE